MINKFIIIFILILFIIFFYNIIKYNNKKKIFLIKNKDILSISKKKSKNDIHNKLKYGMKIIHQIFNKHNIWYVCAFGTLLGLTRHKNIIKWDDDIDLLIYRKDVKKILKLKNEFKRYNLNLESNWKLLKIYFNEEKYPFIDFFIIDIDENNNIIRCKKNYFEKCNTLPKNKKWWWNYFQFPLSYIKNRKLGEFGELSLWIPEENKKLLKYWYGNDCLTVCRSPVYDHITGKYKKSQIINCETKVFN